MKRQLLTYAALLAAATFFTACPTGEDSTTSDAYNPDGYVTPLDDIIAPDQNLAEAKPDTPPVLTDCEAWRGLEGWWSVQVGKNLWEWSLGQFQIIPEGYVGHGQCAALADDHFMVEQVVGDTEALAYGDIVACGPQLGLDPPPVCLKLEEDGSLVMWGYGVGPEPVTIPPRE